jgi:hypothetical protein
MTPEEAKKILQDYRPQRPRMTEQRKLQQAIDLAMDALNMLIPVEYPQMCLTCRHFHDMDVDGTGYCSYWFRKFGSHDVCSVYKAVRE